MSDISHQYTYIHSTQMHILYTPRMVHILPFFRTSEISHKYASHISHKDTYTHSTQMHIHTFHTNTHITHIGDGPDTPILLDARNFTPIHIHTFHTNTHFTHIADGPDTPVLLDVRNFYESKVGLFEGAVPLNTVTFRYKNLISDILIYYTLRIYYILYISTRAEWPV
jgi:hypothetical protein